VTALSIKVKTLFLTKFASGVTILERGKEPKASAALQEKVAERDDMQVLTETVIEEFTGKGKLESVVIKDQSSGETREMRPGAVFVFVGLLPNTGFLQGVIELNEYGFIVTKPNLEASLPGVFAAGDCRVGSTKQIVSAMGEGATVALMVREYLERRGEIAHAPVEVPEGAESDQPVSPESPG
jgi:thioredoxin reductase (NADPH)